LTPEQKERVDTFDLGDMMGFGKPEFKRLFDKDNPAKFIQNIRNAPPAEYDALMTKLKLRAEKADKGDEKGNGRLKKGKKERLQSLIALIEMIRNMPEDEFNSKMSTIQQQFGI